MNKIAIKIIFYALVAGVAFGAALLYFRSTTKTEYAGEIPRVEQSETLSQVQKPTCIITVNGKIYDVQPLRSTHEGGDIFKCGTDMSETYRNQHGESVERIEKYLIKQ